MLAEAAAAFSGWGSGWGAVGFFAAGVLGILGWLACLLLEEEEDRGGGGFLAGVGRILIRRPSGLDTGKRRSFHFFFSDLKGDGLPR